MLGQLEQLVLVILDKQVLEILELLEEVAVVEEVELASEAQEILLEILDFLAIPEILEEEILLEIQDLLGVVEVVDSTHQQPQEEWEQLEVLDPQDQQEILIRVLLAIQV